MAEILNLHHFRSIQEKASLLRLKEVSLSQRQQAQDGLCMLGNIKMIHYREEKIVLR